VISKTQSPQVQTPLNRQQKNRPSPASHADYCRNYGTLVREIQVSISPLDGALAGGVRWSKSYISNITASPSTSSSNHRDEINFATTSTF